MAEAPDATFSDKSVAAMRLRSGKLKSRLAREVPDEVFH
jgi:hypothetical protein